MPRRRVRSRMMDEHARTGRVPTDEEVVEFAVAGDRDAALEAVARFRGRLTRIPPDPLTSFFIRAFAEILQGAPADAALKVKRPRYRPALRAQYARDADLAKAVRAKIGTPGRHGKPMTKTAAMAAVAEERGVDEATVKRACRLFTSILPARPKRGR